MSHELPHCFYRQTLGAIGENRKDLGNTNIQERILKKLYPKASWNGGILTEFYNGYVRYLKIWKIERFEVLDREQADNDEKEVVAALLLQNSELVKSSIERKTS